MASFYMSGALTPGGAPLDCARATAAARRRSAASSAGSSPGTPRHGRDLPWRRTRVALSRAGVRDHAAADAGRPRDAEVPPVPPALSDHASAGRGAGRRRAAALVPARLQRPPAAPARDRAARRSRATAAACPTTPSALRALPGIGRYTAGAILSFAYGRDMAVLDTNVRRVLGRVFLGPRRRRARARRQRRSGTSRRRSCRPAAATTSTRRSWTSAPPGARRAGRAAPPAPCARSARPTRGAAR